MKVYLDSKLVDAKVTENMGFQDGVYVKAVECKGKEYIVTKVGGRWRPRIIEEKIRPASRGMGQRS